MNQELINYIKNQRMQGVPDGQIKTALINAGWGEQQVEDGLREAPNNGYYRPNIEKVSRRADNFNTASTSNYQNGAGTVQFPPFSHQLKITFAHFWEKKKLLISILVLPIFLSLLFTILFPNLGSLLAAIMNIFASVAAISVLGNNQTTVVQGYKNAIVKFIPATIAGILSSLAILGGSMVFIIPGIILSVWLSQVPFIVVLENIKEMRALHRSVAYVKGRGWSVFWRLFVFEIIIGTPILFIYPILLSVEANQGLNILATLIVGVLILISYALFYSFQYKIYQDLKATRPELTENEAKKSKGLSCLIITFPLIIILGIGLAILIGAMSGNRSAQMLDSIKNDIEAPRESQEAHDVMRQADLAQIQMVLEEYYIDSGDEMYPQSLYEISNYFYEGKIPTDPINKGEFQYTYAISADKKSYTLSAKMDEYVKNDPRIKDGIMTLTSLNN